jgi:hypothetical protein
MPDHVCNNATLKCMFGSATSMLGVLPVNRVLTSNQPAGNIMDHIPLVNIRPFGMCNSPSNPMFIAATAAALGPPTPVPCIPITPAPWVTGSPTVLLAMLPSLNKSAILMCTWAGTITVEQEGQTTHEIP